MTTRFLKRWGAALGLFAYCFQLLISLGHLHADEVYGPLGHAIETGVGLERVTAPAGGHSNSSDLQDQADTTDACAICAVVHLVASGIPPQSARLAILVASGGIERFASATLVLTPPPYLLSLTRAPPAHSV